MSKNDLIKNLREDIEAFGEKKQVYAQWADGKTADYSRTRERKCVDLETLGNLLIILENE